MTCAVRPCRGLEVRGPCSAFCFDENAVIHIRDDLIRTVTGIAEQADFIADRWTRVALLPLRAARLPARGTEHLDSGRKLRFGVPALSCFQARTLLARGKRAPKRSTFRGSSKRLQLHCQARYFSLLAAPQTGCKAAELSTPLETYFSPPRPERRAR
jgi:hypothetical protein